MLTNEDLSKAPHAFTIACMHQHVAIEWGAFLYKSRTMAKAECDALNEADDQLDQAGHWQVIEYGRPMFVDETCRQV
ncbi:hypothetical protein RIU76_06400 [Latilactobacillus sakei subsp. sakei]|uniref:hypothetical protein n=1 Tax=Latilactobacillus sakei TaxID=1599 RepID=UPI0028619E8B|nr:hypothetical protein [Latilactobacillus sakei]MDR7924355.1 hypothetical protein [Latilactobacillus sakei subsp. sakei]